MLRTIGFYGYLIINAIKKAKRFGYIYNHINETNQSRYRRELDIVAEKVCSKMLKIAGAMVHIKGIENVDVNETYLFVGNHQSNVDIPLLYAYLPIKSAFVAKEELYKLPVIGKAMKARGAIFLTRKDNRKDIKSIMEGIEFLKNGNSMVVFPEGTRSKGKEMLEFKSGALRLAVKSNRKIIPVTINGTYKVMESNGGIIKPAEVNLTFGPPIDPSEFKDANELSHYVEEQIKKHLN